MDTCQKSRNLIVDRAAKRAAPLTARVDKRGRDQDDYRQLFLIRAWQASQTTPDHGTDVAEKWEFTAVRNHLRSCHRELKRHPEMARFDLLEDDEMHGPSFEGRMEVRQVVRKLEDHLNPTELALLAAYVAHGCSTVRVWSAYGETVTYRYFCKRLRELRIKCCCFIQKICPEMVPKTVRPAL
jgi:DNA-directed RNA polymerase specialized sigma24 family protein